ncbi:hypothetical protein BG011_000365 [Mortierella polycephala]|uniref:Uncharacterized protein n=1 Tax=Mortierella polycephala TaxID=41804 RepID=A0A9P6PJ67_9FUNG|nr:hypothetical protein BG011_000365 [Mortierella polycephala]
MPSSPILPTQAAEISMQSSTMPDSEQPVTPRKRRLSTDTALAPTTEPMELIQDRESMLESPEASGDMLEQENKDQVPRMVVHSFGKKLRIHVKDRQAEGRFQPAAMSIMKHIPGSKTTAAGARAAAEAQAVARNTTVAVATGIVVEVTTPFPSPAPVRSSSSTLNSLDAIVPWTVPPAKKTIQSTLPLEVIPENPDISDDEKTSEPERSNNTVDVVPSSVDSALLSITES